MAKRRSIANINLHKSHNKYFCTSSYRLRDISMLNFDLENLGQVHGGEKQDFRRSISNIKLHQSYTSHSCASAPVCAI